MSYPKPKWMLDNEKPESETWCAKHRCNKTWMISSGFCGKCEQEAHGEKGTIGSSPPSDDDYIDLEVTVPDFKIIKNCIDCFLGNSHAFGKLCTTAWTSYHYKISHNECHCENSLHKFNAGTGFYQCQSCLEYNREFNKC